MKYHIKFLLSVIVGALFIMMDSFYNGYPLFYSDSECYINSGFRLFFPGDRPITYGLFIRASSFNGLSLWLVVFFQSLILSYLIFLFLRQIFDENKFIMYGLIIIPVLSLCTGLSWTASQVMPDIFTAITLLSVFLIVFGNTSKATRIFLYIIFIISVSMHLSHIVLFSLVLAFTLLLRKWLMPQLGRKKRFIHIFILLLITISAELPMRKALDTSKYVVFMGAMSEQGIAKAYLDEYCGTKNYMLCKYKDSLPHYCSEFVWASNSPFNKIGGWTPLVREEFEDIAYATLTKPKYIGLHIAASLKATYTQLISLNISDGTGSFKDSNGAVYHPIHNYFNNEFNTYMHSRQNNMHWIYPGYEFFSPFFYYVEILSILLLLLSLIYYRKLFTGLFKTATILITATVVLSSWDLATFAGVTNHYGCKMAWLIPFLTLVTVFKIIEARKRNIA